MFSLTLSIEHLKGQLLPFAEAYEAFKMIVLGHSDILPSNYGIKELYEDYKRADLAIELNFSKAIYFLNKKEKR